MGKKTVSVVMCTYNGEKYLREQLDSIIQQTYPINELIVQDDCSTDNTVAIIEEYIQKYPFIKLFVNDHNIGFNQNFKRAAMRATGDYVALSDQDDVWFPEKIEKQVLTIGNHDICWSSYLRGKDIESSQARHFKYSFERLLFCSNIAGHTMLCQRHFIQNESHWLDNIWYDWSLSLHASLNNGTVKVEDALNLHRLHESEAAGKEFIRYQNDRPDIFKPYIWGYRSFRKLQKNKNRKAIYTYLYHQTGEEKFTLIHHMCELLIKEDFISCMRLCRLCQKHRQTIYVSDKEPKGVMGWIRGFFFPLFHAYAPTTMILYKDFSKDVCK
jgi:glycosyltransferase involved in cell wall biosynthesis